MEAFERRKFYNAEIELTNGCCLSCVYCYASTKSIATHELKPKTARKLIDSLTTYGLGSFWWGGGEPLLNRHWSEILAYAKEKGATENLVFTNALLLTKKNCRDLCEFADRVTVHLDTVRESTFRKMQIHEDKSKQLHARVLKGIDNLLEAGFSSSMIRWNITLTRTTLYDLEPTLVYAIRRKRVRTTVLIPLFNCGRASTIYQKERLSVVDLENAFSLRAEIEKRPYLLRLGPSEFCKQYQLTSFAINITGDVLPYVDYFKPAGNIYRENVCDIIEKEFDFLSFKELVSADTYENRLHGKCNGCRDEKYCFGNPTMTLNNWGRLYDSDPNCWRDSPVGDTQSPYPSMH